MFDQLKNPYLSVWRDGGEVCVSFRADVPAREDSIYVFASLSEWLSLCDGAWERIHIDGIRTVLVHGDHWVIYDTPQPSPLKPIGEVTIRYLSLSMPTGALERWNALIAPALEGVDPGERVRIDPDPAWWDHYGVGKGSVDLVADDFTVARLAELAGDTSFASCRERLEAIARGQTTHRGDSAPLHLQAHRGDDREFYFRAGGLAGGVIRHDSGWSIHT